MRLAVIQRTLRNFAAEHFLQTHSLSTELKRILRPCFWLAALILHGVRLPQALALLERNSDLATAEFQHVARARHTERAGEHAHIPRDEKISPTLGERTVVRVFVQDCTVRRAVVFCPLVFDVDESPLPATEAEMLQAGELEKVLFGIDHPLRVQVTPSGRCASSTVTA